MKKIITTLSLVSLALLPQLVLAQTLLNYTGNVPLGSANLIDAVLQTLNWILGFLGLIAVLIILWGGFLWMTAGGNEEKVGKAKGTLIAGVIGLIIVLAAYAIAFFVISQFQIFTGVTVS